MGVNMRPISVQRIADTTMTEIHRLINLGIISTPPGYQSIRLDYEKNKLANADVSTCKFVDNARCRRTRRVKKTKHTSK